MGDLSSEGKSLLEHTIEELLQMADEFDVMAAGASTVDAEQALRRLATRFRIFATTHAASQPVGGAVAPGKAAPHTGVYELRNVFGTQSGDKISARRGDLLPRAPREFKWHLTSP